MEEVGILLLITTGDPIIATASRTLKKEYRVVDTERKKYYFVLGFGEESSWHLLDCLRRKHQAVSFSRRATVGNQDLFFFY